jgi:hypothetical protein
MGVVIEICVKYPGGRTRNKGTDVDRRERVAVKADVTGCGATVRINSGSNGLAVCRVMVLLRLLYNYYCT